MKPTIIPVIIMFLLLPACGNNAGTGPESPPPNPASAAELQELERLILNDQGVLYVEPNIRSSDDLKHFKAQKIAEMEQILKDTEQDSAEKPYYPVIITMARPVPLAELRQMLSKYNPSVAKVLKSSGTINYLPKADVVKNEDALIIDSVKFVSTEGGGQLSYETLTKEKEMSKLEKQIALKEKELNGVEDYQLVKGITSASGGIHRDIIMPIQEDSNVFLADIGPAAMYRDKIEKTVWRDVYSEVEKYSK